MPRRPFSSFLSLAPLALALAGCGGDTDAAVAVGGGGGTVVVVVTDGPVDPESFSHIFVTFTGITLIGEDGQVDVFDGRETVDLRDVEDTSTLLGVGRDVPAGDYQKIRLDVEEIELVSVSDGSSSFPKLPPKIDLNPRGGFHVDAGETVLVQIDMDAGKSIHIVETGNGGLRFRPVVFVDILSGGDGKLVLLHGVVEAIGPESFLLCDTHTVTRRASGSDDDCVSVRVDSDTSFFDESGDPTELASLDTGDAANVLGRFAPQGDELLFDAEVVQLGDDAVALDGDVASPAGGDGRFALELDPGQGIVTDDGLLAVQLQPGTRLFARDGEELEPEALEIGDAARVLGVLSLSSSDDDVLKAAAVLVDVEGGTQDDALEGEISSVSSGGARIAVDDEASGNTCVNVPSSARVFLVTSNGSGAEVGAIDRSQLRVGDEVSVFGSPGGDCFDAETVIVVDES
jgi:hypothetical protein